MPSQLVLSINSDADSFRWCWLTNGQTQSSASGNFDALRAALGDVAQQAWLLLPGAKVVTRTLEYTEKEKKHLRNLLPFQLEETVVGDIDDLHVAIGTAATGKVALAYTDKQWLKTVFNRLAEIGVEITRCWSTPLLLPLNNANSQRHVEPKLSRSETAIDVNELATATAIDKLTSTWAINLENNQVNIRFAEQEGFSVPFALLDHALGMLISDQKSKDNLPDLVLSASSENDLVKLYQSLPDDLAERVSAQTLVHQWTLDFNGKAIDLCQAEFSQRLPLERWMKLWRNVGILAAITFAVYVAVLGFNIYKLNKQSLDIQRQMEAVYRSVIPNGQANDPEKRLRSKLQQLQPKAQTGSVMATLAGVLPIIAVNTDVAVKVVSYSADTGEMSVSVQAHSFNSIDALRQSLSAQGYTAELLTANAQGDLNTGRLKITQQQH